MRPLLPSVALVTAVFLLGCQEQGSGPAGPDAPGIQAAKGGIPGPPLFASGAPMPFTATLTFPEDPDPSDEGQRTVTGGVEHIRNQVNRGTISGDINGDATAVLNAHLSLTTGTGPVYGTFTFTNTDAGNFEGNFQGRQITLDLASGHFRVSGSGGIIIGTFTGDGVVLVLTGRIRG